MTELTAIDILIDPDRHAIERPSEVNAVLLKSMPEGWKLDENHQPLDFRAELVAAVAPYVESGGTAEAFVTDPGEVISPTIIDWVEAFVPNRIGAGKYFPHLTVGVDTFEHSKIIEAQPFDSFTFHPASVAVYHLGNDGTARKLLKGWPVANA